MSAIGNYVHYTAAGYNKTGTNTQRQKPSISASQALSLQKQDINNRILVIRIQEVIQWAFLIFGFFFNSTKFSLTHWRIPE